MTISLTPSVLAQHVVVKRMLAMAQIGKGGVIFDLGCGDGRILLSAVKECDAEQAVGYELREDLYTGVIERIQNECLGERVAVFHDDVFNADFSEATVIALYLTTIGNRKVKAKFTQEARAGTRIVSHSFRIEGWLPPLQDSESDHPINVYTIPNSLKSETNTFRRSFEINEFSNFLDY